MTYVHPDPPSPNFPCVAECHLVLSITNDKEEGSDTSDGADLRALPYDNASARCPLVPSSRCSPLCRGKSCIRVSPPESVGKGQMEGWIEPSRSHTS